MKIQSAAVLASLLAYAGVASMACGSEGGPGPAWSEPTTAVDSLLAVGDGGALNACGQCIRSSCGGELTSLETELKSVRTAERTAFSCVRADKCLSLFWENRDAGAKAAEADVTACVAACDADAGVPERDAARSEIRNLASALGSCVDASCASACPAAAKAARDR